MRWKTNLPAIVLCAFWQIVPSFYITLPTPTPLGDYTFYTNCPMGDGPVLGMRKAACWDKDMHSFRYAPIVNIPYANLDDAMKGIPAPWMEGRWWWYPKFSNPNGRICGNWTWP